MRPALLIKENIVMPCSAEQARRFLQDLRTIEKYEPKLTHAEVHPSGETGGTYETRGYFAGLPWHGKFSYKLNPAGFFSEMLEGPVQGLQVSGGFAVAALGPSRCLVTHHEKYSFRAWYLLLPLLPVIKAYLTLAMHKELQDLKALILETLAQAPSPAGVSV